MIQTHSVTVKVTTTTTDDLNNSTETTVDRTATGILFAPEGLAETFSVTAPRVLGTATLYGNTGICGADDRVVHAAPCCDGSLFPFGTWQVVGGSKGWAPGKFAVPIQRAADQ